MLVPPRRSPPAQSLRTVVLALAANLVPPHRLLNALSLTAATQHMSKLVGPGLVAPVLGLLGVAPAFFLWPGSQAVATRNSRRITETTLLKLDLPFDLVLTRDDGPVKPDPWPVQEAARRWTISTAEIVVVGDYRFDVECGRAAQSQTVLLTHPDDPRTYANAEQADLVLRSLAEHAALLDFLELL